MDKFTNTYTNTNANLNYNNINNTNINTNSIYHFNTNSISQINTLPSYKSFREKNIICVLHQKFEPNKEHLNNDNIKLKRLMRQVEKININLLLLKKEI